MPELKMDLIAPGLWLGDATDGQHPDLPDYVHVAVNCMLEYSIERDDVDVWNIGFADAHPIPDAKLFKALAVITKAHLEGKSVLVHCAAGISRSPTVVALYLAQKNRTSFDRALEHVQKCRPKVNPDPTTRRSAIEYMSRQAKERATRATRIGGPLIPPLRSPSTVNE